MRQTPVQDITGWRHTKRNVFMVKVLYFGTARQITGKAEEELMAHDTAGLKHLIIVSYPELRKVPFRLALNGSLLNEETMLENGDKIAVLPPFAGG